MRNVKKVHNAKREIFIVLKFFTQSLPLAGEGGPLAVDEVFNVENPNGFSF